MTKMFMNNMTHYGTKAAVLALSAVFATVTVPTMSHAQGAEDALMFSQVKYEGSARTMAMGNAFTALGGDLGSIAVNPAASGVYRYSQFSVTPSITVNGSQSTYINNSQRNFAADLLIPNMGAVITFDTDRYYGLLNFNLGFTTSRIADFNSVMGAHGTTASTSILGAIASELEGTPSSLLEGSGRYNTTASWPSVLAWNTYLLATIDDTDEYVASTENIDGYNIYVGGDLVQDYYRKTSGGINEFAVNFGTNISDIVYLGANLNIESVRYTVDETYTETAVDTDDFQDGFDSMRKEYWQSTTGAGFNFKFGVIATPVAGLRLGATITTPTWYSLTDNWQHYMSSSFDNGNKFSENSPTGSYSYRVTAPMRFSLGAAYTYGSLGLVSLDYERVNYKSIRMAESNGNTVSFQDDNNFISTYYKATGILRAGIEVWATDFLAVRAGYTRYGSEGYFGNTNDDIYPAQNYISCGVGFKLGGKGKSAIDVAYRGRIVPSDKNLDYFTLYDDYGGLAAPVGSLKSFGNKIAVTWSLKF